MQELQKLIDSTRDLKLLYVEDNEAARNSILDILKEFFNDIVVGVDGEDGLEKFKSNSIDLIITDINMPKMNGLEMLAEIKKEKSDVITIICSAYNESEYFVESIKLGVEGYLLKPIDFMQFMTLLEKVTEKSQAKKSQELLKQYKDVTDKSSIMSIIDTDLKITYVNSAFCKISEYTKEELIGKDYVLTTNFTQEDSLNNEIWRTIKEEKKTWQGIVKNVSKNGRPYYLDSTIKPILDTNDEIIEYIALRHDVTAIMNPFKRLNDLISSSSKPMAVLVKIENFDNIENFYGQKLTQEIEESFAAQLFDFMPKGSGFKNVFILRNGEYAFAKDRANSTKTDQDVIKELQLFQKSVNDAKIEIDGLDYDISVIISIAYGDEVLENAMYGVKQLLETKQNFIVANDLASKEHTQAQVNINILKMIKVAMDRSRIISYFQPIVNNKTKKIEKYESLVRLIDNDENIVSPFFFLNIAKKGKYYTQITSIVLDNSFKALDITEADISINISALDIEKEQISQKIFSLLEQHKESAHRVVLELLEDEEVKDFEVIKSFISKVKALGVSIAIDDFGSGYSSFERLLEYQPDILKLDGGLIKNIESDKFSLSIVKTMVNFAKEQNIKVVAEYVENEGIYNILCDLGVDYSQGYYFGKPEPLE